MKVKLTYDGDSLGTTEAVLDEAGNCNLKVEAINSPGWGLKPLNNTTYEILTLSIQVTGAVGDVANFVERLSQRFPTSMVETVQISGNNAPTPESTETPTATAAPDYTANVNLVIYSYKGDQ